MTCEFHRFISAKKIEGDPEKIFDVFYVIETGGIIERGKLNSDRISGGIWLRRLRRYGLIY